MPLAEADMTTPTPNGTPAQSSAFFSHLDQLPIVHDSVVAFKTNSYGQKTISISQTAYVKLVSPFSPIITKVNGYASPYISKADSLADTGLGKFESVFPFVKEPTDKIVGYPKSLYEARKSYLTEVYETQYNKAEGSKGVVNHAKAGVMTGRIVTGDLVLWLTSFLATKKEETKEVMNEKAN